MKRRTEHHKNLVIWNKNKRKIKHIIDKRCSENPTQDRKEIRDFIREQKIYLYIDLRDYAAKYRPEWMNYIKKQRRFLFTYMDNKIRTEYGNVRTGRKKQLDIYRQKEYARQNYEMTTEKISRPLDEALKEER